MTVLAHKPPWDHSEIELHLRPLPGASPRILLMFAIKLLRHAQPPGKLRGPTGRHKWREARDSLFAAVAKIEER